MGTWPGMACLRGPAAPRFWHHGGWRAAETKNQQSVLTSLPAEVGTEPAGPWTAAVLWEGRDASGCLRLCSQVFGQETLSWMGGGPRGTRPAAAWPPELGSEDTRLSSFTDAPSPALGTGVLG